MFIVGIILHYHFEKGICHNGFITKSYPPNVLSNVLLEKNIAGQHTCHMKCRDMISHQCVFSAVQQEHNAVRKICYTSCIYTFFLQHVTALYYQNFILQVG